MEVEMTGSGEVATPSTPSVSAPTSEPSAVDLRDDTLVRVPGQQNPVKYGDYYKGFQSQFTRKAQEAAEAQRRFTELEKRYNEERQGWQRQSQGPQGQSQNPANAMLEKIRALPYLNGQEAAEVVEQLVGQFGSFGQALQQRDMVMLQLAKHIQKQNEQLAGITNRHSAGEFEGKIDRWVQSMGLPQEARELAQEIYLAYEGDDLDNEFPAIFQRRWEQIETMVRARDKQRAQSARQLPFTPGRGGNAGPSKPLNQGFKTAKEITDELWPSVREATEG